jgi:glycosyltransferase involved in cell wall biosynthesis
VKLSVIVPVYNERATLETTLRRVLAVDLDKEVIAVDDGSTDGSGEILDRMREEGVIVVHQPRNMGKGMAIRTAIGHVTGEIAIIQDADGEYEPQEYPSLIQPIVEGRAAVVYGSRFRGRVEGMRWPNRLINRLLAWMANLLFGARITDEATCYKVFKTEVLKELPLRCTGFEFCPEITARVLKRGYRIVEVPISYRARTHEEGKKINWRDGVRAIWTLLRYRFRD